MPDVQQYTTLLEKNIIDQSDRIAKHVGNKQIDFQQSFVQTHFDLNQKVIWKANVLNFRLY